MMQKQRVRLWDQPFSTGVLFFYVLSAAYALMLIWQHLNFLQMDLAGHMASGAWFQRGYFHQYQDGNFLGYVHGLFYPPLEDFLISALRWIVPQSPVLGFQIYLSLVLVAFLWAGFSLGGVFRTPGAQSTSRLLFLAIFWFAKKGGLYYQGLSLEDLLVTGLSSQFLGGVFFFLFLKEWMQGLRPRQGVVYLSLCILSHIVVSFACALVLLVHWISSKQPRKSIGFILLTSVVLCSFYLIPFVAYRSQLTTSNIFHADIWQVSLALLAILIGFFTLASTFSRVLLIAAILCTIPTIFGQWFPAIQDFLPRFHHYRFAVFSLYLGALGYSGILDGFFSNNWPMGRQRSFRIISVIAGLVIFSRFSVFAPSLDRPAFTKAKVDLSGLGLTHFPEYGRYWVIGTDRSADFGIDSYLQSLDSEFRSLKGLYWESSRNNLALSSYLATLLSSPVVLDHFFYWGYDCTVQKCLMDHFFRDYNVRGMMIQEDRGLRYIRPERQACFREFVSKGETNFYRLKKMGEFSALGQKFSNFWLEPKTPGSLGKKNFNDALEVVSFLDLLPFAQGDKSSFSNHLKSIFMTCQTGKMSDAVFIDSREYSRLRSEFTSRGGKGSSSTPVEGSLEFRRESPGRFHIHVPGDQDVLFKIKLSYFPLLRLTRADGSEVKLFDAFPSTLALAHGDLVLEFRRSGVMVFAYGVSILGLLIVLVFWRRMLQKLGLRSQA